MGRAEGLPDSILRKDLRKAFCDGIQFFLRPATERKPALFAVGSKTHCNMQNAAAPKRATSQYFRRHFERV